MSGNQVFMKLVTPKFFHWLLNAAAAVIQNKQRKTTESNHLCDKVTVSHLKPEMMLTGGGQGIFYSVTFPIVIKAITN